MTSFLLKQLYPKAIDGLPLLGTPDKHAALFSNRSSTREQANLMIAPHIALAGATGFVTGLGGWLTMPVTVPADLAGVALLQLHMAASCAVLAEKDLSDPVTKEMIVSCLLKRDEGEPNTEKEETINRVTVKVAERGIRSLAKTAIVWGASAAGRRIGGRIARGVPFLGGAIGAVSDSYNTRMVAKHTLGTFFPTPEDADKETDPALLAA